LAELVAINSGAACMVSPEGSPVSASFDRIVVAWNGSREARHALGEGMAFIEAARDVRVVTIGWEPDQGSIDDLLRHLAVHGVEAGFERVTNHVDHGTAIIDRCARFGADLLIMGAFAHPPATEMILGGATRTVLNETPLPVLMAH
jgi:nucleotide-binding universal stress UspA family protein